MSVSDNGDEFIALSYLADWHTFDWYNGNLKSDAALVTRNLTITTRTDTQHQVLSSLSDSNKSKQLAIAEQLKNSLLGLKNS